MTKKLDIYKSLKDVAEMDSRYDAEAYKFVLNSLEHTLKKLKKIRHISGKELLSGIKEYGLREYGPMTKTVLSHWGVETCSDFGEIVFNLVKHGLLKKNTEDSQEDFINGYDFTEAFEAPFIN